MKNRVFDNNPNNPNQNPHPPKINKLVGIGLDNHDGHKRITTAEKFSVVGGSEETHGRMTETLSKTFEDLGRKGKTLEQAHPKEIIDLINKHS